MKFVASEFKQHSVLVEDGYTGLRKFVEWVRTDQPALHADINRVFADGDYVILDVQMIRHPGDRGLAIAEIYRVQDGKLVEHWDRIQEIPKNLKMATGCFEPIRSTRRRRAPFLSNRQPPIAWRRRVLFSQLGAS